MGRKKVIVDRRARILETAQELFPHYTVEKTTMDDISRHAGVPRATVYLEFPGGKDDIMMTLVESTLDDYLEKMREIVEAAEPGRHLEALHQAMLFVTLTSKQHATHFTEFTNMERLSKRVYQDMTRFFEERRALLAACISRAIDDNEIPPCDSVKIADMINHVFCAYAPTNTQRLSLAEVEERASHFYRILLAGLKAVPQ